MPSTSDNELRPVKLQFGHSVLCPFDETVFSNNNATITIPSEAGGGGAQWATFAATSAATTAFGSFAFSVTIDSLGNNAKPVMVGVVPRQFTAFDAKLSVAGWGVSTSGKAYAFNASSPKSDIANVTVSNGDKVTVRVDCTNTASPTVTFAIESKKSKKPTEHTVKLPTFGNTWLVPAVSLCSAGAQATIETLVDTTPLTSFASRLQQQQSDSNAASEDLCFECDSFGNFFLRWYRRMSDNDTVKTAAGTWTKADVRLRTVLFGHETNPIWGRAPLAGVFDGDSTHKRLAMYYNEQCRAVAIDAAQAKKIAELVTSPPDAATKTLLVRCGSPVATSFALAQTVIGTASASQSQPILALNTSSQFSQATAAQETKEELKALTDRIASLERRSTAAAATSSTNGGDAAGNDNSNTGSPGGKSTGAGGLRRTESKAGGPKAGAGGLNRRGSSTGLQAPPASRVAASKPGSRPISRNATPRKPAQPSKPVTSISTSNKLIAMLQRVRKLQQDLRILSEKGSPSDSDLAEMDKIKKSLAKEKIQLARDLASLPADQLKKEAASEEAASEVASMLSDLVTHGEQHPGNLELVTSIIKHVPADYPTIIKENQLATISAYDSNIELLKLFLSVPNLELDNVELVENALFNQTHRIPVTNLIVDNWDKLGMSAVADDIDEVWQEFFEEICDKDKIKVNEVRKGRDELIRKMMLLKQPKINVMNEGPDGQTPFSRAARQGEIEVMTALLTTVPGAVDVNHVSSLDKTTALIQAVYLNQTAVVRALASLPNINRSHECDDGTAIAIARTLKRDPEIVAALAK